MGNESKPALNKEQQAAAYCTENAVVAAGAGSGKTMVLASRYVWLITEKNYRAKEILTLTFTKKATTQMYQRIYLELKEKAIEDFGEAGKLAQQALDEFAQARIQTIDSYCSSIVKQAANRYGISPFFTIDEDRCRQLAIDEALPFVISNRNHPALERLYNKKKPVAIAEAIFAEALSNHTYIDSPPDIIRDIKNQFKIICGEWKKQCETITGKLEELNQAYQGNEKFHLDLAPLLQQYSKIKNSLFPNDNDLCEYFNQLLDIPHQNAIEWAESHQLQESLTKCLSFLSSLNNLNMRKGTPRENPAKIILYE